VVGGAGRGIGIQGARELIGKIDDDGLCIERQLDLDLLASRDRAASRVALLRPSRQRPRMIATRLRQEWPLMVMITLGRLPAPSASTTCGGTFSPLMGWFGSTWDRNFTVCSCPLV
jgi:hypothetical protein